MLFIIPLAFLGVFFFYPLAAVVRESFAPGGQLNLAPIADLWREPYFGRALWFTTWQATLSTGLTLVLGMPAAFVFARYAFPGKSILRALTAIPFVMPAIVVSAGFAALFGPRGLAQHAVDVLVRPESSSHPAAANHLVDPAGARVLQHHHRRARGGRFLVEPGHQALRGRACAGRQSAARFAEITLPLLLPSITAAGLLIFIFCFTSFGVILILGGPRFATLEVEIYRQAVGLFALPAAAAIGLAQIAITFVIMAIYTRVQASAALPLNLRPAASTAVRPSTPGRIAVVSLIVIGLMLFLVSPLVALAARSFAPADPLRYYRELFVNRTSSIFYVPPGAAIRNSLIFASLTTALALFIGTITAWLLVRTQGRFTRLLDPVVLLPLGTSAVTLGFGYVLALGRAPLNLLTQPLLVPIAHTLIAFPFVVRTLLPVMRGLNPAWRESASVLGASPWHVWREVELPIIGRALLVAALFAFTVSMGEFGATLLIARPEYPTMPVVIYRLLGQPGALNYGQALAMSTLLMAVCAAAFFLIERLRVGEVGEF